MEVAIGLHPEVVGDGRVVDGRDELHLCHVGGVGHGVTHRAGDLWGAAQRVRVLHSFGLLTLASLDEGRVLEQRGDVGCREFLSLVGAQRLQVGGEDRVDATQRLHRHGGGEVGRRHQGVEVCQSHDELTEHAVGAVDESQPLLLTQGDRLETGSRQSFGGWHLGTGLVTHDSLAGEGQGGVGQGCQITRAAQRSVLTRDGGDPGVEHRCVAQHHLAAYPGVARSHRLETQQHHGTDHLTLHLGAGGGRVGADEGVLQDGPLLHWYPLGGQGSESSGYPIVRDDVICQLGDVVGSPVDSGQGLFTHLDRLVVACDGNDIGESEIGSDENGHGNLLGDGTPALACLGTRIDGNRRGAVEVAVSSSEWLG